MEIPRYWRMSKQSVPFRGYLRSNGSGPEVSFTGRTWFPLNGNGHSQEENPFEREIVYQAPTTKSPKDK